MFFQVPDYFREQQDPRFLQIAGNSHELTALKEFFDTSKGTNVISILQSLKCLFTKSLVLL